MPNHQTSFDICNLAQESSLGSVELVLGCFSTVERGFQECFLAGKATGFSFGARDRQHLRLKREETEGNLELERLEQELEGLREEMKLLEEEEKALRRMELARKGGEVGEGVDRNLHSRNLNNSESFKGTYIHEDGTLADSPSPDIQRKTSVLKGESGSRRSGEKLTLTNKPFNSDFLQVPSSFLFLLLLSCFFIGR